MRTKKPATIVASLTINGHRILGEHRRCVKKGPVMLAAVETVAKPDAVGTSRRRKPDIPTQATTRELRFFTSNLDSLPPQSLVHHTKHIGWTGKSHCIYCSQPSLTGPEQPRIMVANGGAR